MRLLIDDTEITRIEKAEPEDLFDGIKTIVPSNKVVAPLQFPGQGPDLFLSWAAIELGEAKTSKDASVIVRKSFNVCVLAKCAVECLIDWYLAKYMLDLTIPKHAGLTRKVEALDAENLLGIGLALFQDIIFGPRNDAIHNYEIVDIDLAEKAYQLSNLTLKNCRNTENPTIAPIFYGSLEFYRNADAFSKLELSERAREVERFSKLEEVTLEYFAGLGPSGTCSVHLDRRGEESRIVLFESHGGGKLEARYCEANQFSSEQMRAIFQHLEAATPVIIELSEGYAGIIKNSLSTEPEST
jgi:hypothetical protein